MIIFKYILKFDMLKMKQTNNNAILITLNLHI